MAKQNRYMVRRATKEVFIWTEQLAKRNDLEEVYAESPQAAVDRNTMPDPKRISLAELEDMSKADLLVFAKIKLNMDLDPSFKVSKILEEIKVAIFSLPSTPREEDTVKPAIEATRPLSTAGAARAQAGA